MTSNVLRDQVFSLGEMIREQTWRLEDELRKAIPTPIQHAARQVILTGCGDSAIAGLGTQFTFRSLARLPALAAEAMEASRYIVPNFAREYPYTPLVFAVSNSGRVSRVAEAAMRAKQVGGYVVGLTGGPSSPLAAQSDATVDVTAPEFPPGPGVRSYVMALVALNLFAIRLAEVRGRISMDQAQGLRRELAGLGDVVEEVSSAADTTLRGLGQEWESMSAFEFLGSGPSRASAAFGAAKLLEAAGAHAASVDLEEFVHLNYFVRAAEQTPTILLAGRNMRAWTRAEEVAAFLKTLRRPWISFGEAPGKGVSIPIPSSVREEFLPIVQAAPLALLAGALMVARGEEPGRGGVGQWSDCSNGGTTTTSRVEGVE